MASGITWDDGPLLNQLRTMNARSQAQLATITKKHAVVAEAHMRQGAPWTDDTGFARANLTAHADVEHPSYSITLVSGAEYGIWLELAHSGRFQIIKPTIDREGAAYLASAATLWASMFGRGRGAT